MKHLTPLCIIIAAAAAVSGCICFPGANAPQADVTPLAGQDKNVSPDMTPSQASPSPAITLKIRPFDTSRAQWVEYKVSDTSGGSESDVRLDYSDRTVNGMSTKTVKRTVSYSGLGSDNGYSYDAGSNTLNVKTSGSASSSSMGTQSSLDQMKANDPVLAAGDLSYTHEGQETVIVPEGTYECDRYGAVFNGVGYTYWAATGVPVPIKIAYENKIMELKGWG
ncbi:MAG TPA: hypothetical protein VGK13_02165 [Methanocellaceae archaeon]